MASSSSLLRADGLLITEFMALNETVLKDDTGEFSDWIEIYNSGTNAVNLAGYYLTDESANLLKWRFPATNLPPSRYLIVFASGLNRVTPGRPFHTNFKLNADGEYLALVQPDGITVVSQFTLTFPPQQLGLSFGQAVEDINTTTLISPLANARLFVPTNEIGTAWIQPGFNDTNWSKATAGLRFDLGTTALSYDNLPGTDVEAAMLGINSTVYLRIPFNGIDVSRVSDLQLWLRYDDGFVAYLNGQEVARRLAPPALLWNAAASAQHTNSLALVPERINLTENLNMLRPGTNVLAIHGMNRTLSDSDFLMLPELVAREVKLVANVQRFFSTPTPGSANVAGLPGTAGSVHFSLKSTTFVDPFLLTLEPADKKPGSVVRYTLDRSVPSESSPVYSSPLNITNSAQVRAAVFAAGLYTGPVRTESFIALNPNVVNFTSDLPIMVIHSFGAGRINGANYQGAIMTIHEPVRGRSALTNTPHLITRAGFKDRGSSTAGQAKANYAVETWDEENRNKLVPILGLPADSEWVFHAPYSFDPALIRNPLAYEFGHHLGRYSSRYRFVEVYINASTTGGQVASNNYAGLYNILEKVKRSTDRVDIDELRVSDIEQPEVTGGYLLKIDRTDPGDTGFSAGGQAIDYVEPTEKEMKTIERDAQKKYLTAYINSFAAALNGANSAHPTLGYAPFIDADAWIDFHIGDALTWNVDALRLSSYFHKVRSGPLTYGPMWDYDRSLGSTDGRDANPRVWGDNFFTWVWWNRLFRDPNFWQKWIDRWQDMRKSEFSNKNMNAIIDSLAAQVAEAAPSDFTKWRQAKRGGTQASEIIFLKNWLANRMDFFDTNLLAKPFFSSPGGQLSSDFTLTMVGPVGATIYYTMDGSDPRLPGGTNISPTALVYTSPITAATTTTVKARARNLSHKNLTGGNNPPISSTWSGLTQARFSVSPAVAVGNLIVSEIHYNPAPPTPRELAVDPKFVSDDFGFIELKNITSDTLDLFGARFVSGIGFSFSGSSMEVLHRGQSVLLVKNRSAFKARYGDRANIAGQYTGSLDNNGERLHLVNSAGATILDFVYNDSWYPITDGHGFSLVLSNENVAPARVGIKPSWRPSATVGGSPGALDPVPSTVPAVVVNEARTHSDKKDSIELHNPTGTAANIGGWFLTDDLSAPTKFRIPNGTTIPAGGFLVFDEDDFNPGKGTSFSLSASGEAIYLFSADASGALQWYLHGFEFGPAEKDVTFGRYRTSTGQEDFVAQTTSTLKSANSGPKIGPIVINEIMYHPPEVFANNNYFDNDEDEFIELRNITTQPVPLFDLAVRTNTWALRGAIAFTFPTNVTIPASGLLVVVGFDPASSPAQLAAFRNKYSVNAAVTIVGPYSGKLDNSTETLKLLKPLTPDDLLNPDRDVPHFLVDSVNYSDEAPWPVAADGLGYSLQRLDSAQYGNDPINWGASLPTPGTANRFGTAPTITTQPQSQTIIRGSSATLSVSATGAGLLGYQWRFQGGNLPRATNSSLTITNAQAASAGEYTVLALSTGNAAVSAPAILTVLQPATITEHPVGQNANPGTTVTLGVAATGTGPIKYQWRLNGINIAGATRASLALADVQLGSSGSYSVVVTDAIGSALSDPALVNVLIKPQITNQPENLAVLVGDTVNLGVSAFGTLPMIFRWLHDGVNIVGATNSILTLTNAQFTDAGIYSVLITNLASARIVTASSDARLLVLADFDKDRMADLWEAANGYATNNASDALLDSDGDGMTNLQEYIADTNPRDRQSYLRFDTIKIGADFSTTLQFTARSNRNYSVQFKPALITPSWLSLTNVHSETANRTGIVIDSSRGSTNRFYRLVTPAVP